uniref:Uncharacterized protein n=1 Tax=Glossina austeni TaxID=7395 RepID=A0A1A9UX80_GLOAU
MEILKITMEPAQPADITLHYTIIPLLPSYHYYTTTPYITRGGLLKGLTPFLFGFCCYLLLIYLIDSSKRYHGQLGYMPHDKPGFRANTAEFSSKHNLKAFEGQKICFFGFPADEHEHMVEVMESNGGIPVELFERMVKKNWSLNDALPMRSNPTTFARISNS